MQSSHTLDQLDICFDDTDLLVLRATLQFDREAWAELEQSRRERGEGPLAFGQFRIPRARERERSGAVVGWRRAALLGSTPTLQPRGALVALEPEPGGTEAQTVSWNSGYPVPETNDSHAERFLYEFIVQTVLGIPRPLPGLKSVATYINLSPCSLCIIWLQELKKKYLQGLSTSLTYSLLYAYDKEGVLHKSATTKDDRNKLVKAHWAIEGPIPGLTDASKEQQIKATRARFEWLKA